MFDEIATFISSYSFSFSAFRTFPPNLYINAGMGISAIAMNPNSELPQPTPRDSNICGPARGKNAATTLRMTEKEASTLAAYAE